MRNAGHETSRVDAAGDVDAIVSAYVAEAGGDPWLALRRVVVDALADLLELSAVAVAPSGSHHAATSVALSVHIARTVRGSA